MTHPLIYLASQSPRRQELLAQLGIRFATISATVDETPLAGEAPRDYVQRLARDKALAGWQQSDGRLPVLGSDTAVVLDERIMGKPQNSEDAENMLASLSGQTHEVMTAVALAIPVEKVNEPELHTVLSVSEVSFKPLSAEAIRRYVAGGEPMDKAGAYAIQGHAAAWISHLCGSYSGVMGLPLHETAELLHKAGISV